MGEPKEVDKRTLVERVCDLDSYTHKALTSSNYPREQRYFLCAEIQRLVTEIMNLAVRAMKGYLQKSTLQNLDIALETLKYKIRESCTKKYISEHRKHVWIMRIEKIGILVGGWIKIKNERR